VAKLIKHFWDTPLTEIDQAAIDEAAVELYPNVTPATRNTCVYTPVAAILHHAKVKILVERPKGAKGRKLVDALVPADAFGIIEAAETFDTEVAVLLMCLLYIGARIGAGLDMQREDVRADELAAWMRHQKGQPSADVRLREDVCDRLVEHLESHDRRRVFRFHYGGHLKYQLVRAKLTYLGIPHPVRRPVPWREPEHRLKWVTFHTFRHTWASWMRRYAKATLDDLVDSGNWKDRRSAARYVHAAPDDDVWSGVDRFPSMGNRRGVKAR
jgi:integrase